MTMVGLVSGTLFRHLQICVSSPLPQFLVGWASSAMWINETAVRTRSPASSGGQDQVPRPWIMSLQQLQHLFEMATARVTLPCIKNYGEGLMWSTHVHLARDVKKLE